MKDLCQIVEGFMELLGCGSKFSESFPQNAEIFPQIGTFKDPFPYYDAFILLNVV